MIPVRHNPAQRTTVVAPLVHRVRIVLGSKRYSLVMDLQMNLGFGFVDTSRRWAFHHPRVWVRNRTNAFATRSRHAHDDAIRELDPLQTQHSMEARSEPGLGFQRSLLAFIIIKISSLVEPAAELARSRQH